MVPKKKEKEIAGASQGSKQEEKPEAVAEVRKLSEDLHVCSRLRNYRTTADCRTSEAPNSSNQQPSINFRGNATPLRLQTIRLWEEFINVGSRLRRKKGIWFERKKMSLSINMTLSSFPEWLQTNSGARISFVLLHFCVLFVFFFRFAGSQLWFQSRQVKLEPSWKKRQQNCRSFFLKAFNEVHLQFVEVGESPVVLTIYYIFASFIPRRGKRRTQNGN